MGTVGISKVVGLAFALMASLPCLGQTDMALRMMIKYSQMDSRNPFRQALRARMLREGLPDPDSFQDEALCELALVAPPSPPLSTDVYGLDMFEELHELLKNFQQYDLTGSEVAELREKTIFSVLKLFELGHLRMLTFNSSKRVLVIEVLTLAVHGMSSTVEAFQRFIEALQKDKFHLGDDRLRLRLLSVLQEGVQKH